MFDKSAAQKLVQESISNDRVAAMTFIETVVRDAFERNRTNKISVETTSHTTPVVSEILTELRKRGFHVSVDSNRNEQYLTIAIV